jgi:cell division transport system permease protein
MLVGMGFMFLGDSVAVLSASYQSDFKLTGLGFSGVLSLMFISTSLGLFGAWLAVGRHLSDIEPR